jgi:hypothetical protein
MKKGASFGKGGVEEEVKEKVSGLFYERYPWKQKGEVKRC